MEHKEKMLMKRNPKDFENRNKDEVFIDSRGIRYRCMNPGDCRQLCIGNNDTCPSLRNKNNLCVGCVNGTNKLRNMDYEEGKIYDYNGEPRIFYKGQLRIICKEPNCQIVSVHQGRCKKHSSHWHCKFTGEKCTSIRVNRTNYCAKHKDNIANKKEKSKGEIIISEWLNENGTEFECNKSLICDNVWLYPDFIFVDDQLMIEFDGKQHFDDIKYWGGKEGLASRKENDVIKDNWCRKNGYKLLRISYKDINLISHYLSWYFDNYHNYPPGTIFSTAFAGYEDRDYIFIEL